MKIIEITNKSKKDGTPYRLIKLQIDEENVKQGGFWNNEVALEVGQEVNWTVKQNGDFINFYENSGTSKPKLSGTTVEIRLQFLEDAVKQLDARLKALERKGQNGYGEAIKNEDLPF